MSYRDLLETLSHTDLVNMYKRDLKDYAREFNEKPKSMVDRLVGRKEITTDMIHNEINKHISGEKVKNPLLNDKDVKYFTILRNDISSALTKEKEHNV